MTRLLLLALLSGCVNYVGNGVSATEERDLRPVVEVLAASPLDVLVDPGETPSLSVTCDENLLPYIQTVVDQGALTVRTEPGVSITPRTACFAEATLDGVRIARNAGSGDLLVTAGSDVETARVSGSGRLEVTGIDVDRVELSDSGSGDLLAAGATLELEARVTGSGTIDASDLVADRVEAHNAGSGDLLVHATDSVAAFLAGSGDIEVFGGPADVTEDDDGSGRIVVH